MTLAHSISSSSFGSGSGSGSGSGCAESRQVVPKKQQKQYGTQSQGLLSSSSESSTGAHQQQHQGTSVHSRPNSPTRLHALNVNSSKAPLHLPFALTAAAQALAQAKPPTSFTTLALTSTPTPTSTPSTTAALHIPHMPSSPLVLPLARTLGTPSLGQNQTSTSASTSTSTSSSGCGSPALGPSSSLSLSSSASSSPSASPLRYGTLVNVNGANLPTYALIQQHFQHPFHLPQQQQQQQQAAPIVDYFSIPISHPSSFPAHSHSQSPYPTPTSEFTMAPPAIASALPLIPASAPPAPADPYAFMSAASTGFPLHAAAAAASSASLYAHHSLLAGAGNGIPAGPFQIRILGVPTVGAKSRVETQIKLCLQLVSASGEKVTRYRRLRIPDLLVANDRWKRHGQLASARGAAAAGVPGLVEPSSMSEERDTLWLHGKVICASDPEKIVKVCSGCVQRETKRASRRKYPPKPLPADPVTLPTPPASVSNSPTPRPASATAPANPPVSDILMSERKTMLIHAPPVLDFASGDAMLPLRIPCYCRHHKEKLGFILQFELRDTQGRVVAKGESAPILITDDHKTSKKSQPKETEATEANGEAKATDAVMDETQHKLAQGVKRPSPDDGEASTSLSSTSSADEQSPVAHPFSSPMSLLGLPDIRLPTTSATSSSVTLPPASAMPPSPRMSPTSATSPQAALEAQQQQHQDVQMFGADLLSQVMYLPNMSSAPNSASALLSSVQSPPASMATAAESGDTYARKRPRVTPPPLLAHAGGSGQASQVASPISPPHTAHGSPGLAGGVPLGNLVFAPAASTSPSPQRLPPVPSGTISPSSLSFGSNSSTSATAADIEAFTAAIQQPFMAALQLPTSVAQAQANPAMAAMTTMQPLTLPIVASTATAVDANALMFQQFATSQQQQQPIPLAQFLQAAGAISAVVPQHPPMGVMTAQQQQQQPLAMSMPAAPEPASTSWLPKLERVVPNEGPLQGGIEVTVLGTGFNESLTVQFGSVPAHTVYWSPNTLVCTVPPGTQPGPVPVVIKQVADLGLTDTNQAQAPPVTFTYKDANSERQLLELALTLLGYNLTPASTTSPSPPTSAAHSTVNPSSLFSLLGNGNGSYGHQHQHVESTTDALLHMLTDATSATSPLELAALRAVQRMVATHPPASEASAATVLDARRSATGAALVHLAAANKFGRLLRWLVREAKVDAGVRDGLGRTPVEIAEAQGWQEGVEVLSGVFETPAGDVTTSKPPRPASPVKSQKAKVVVLDKLEDAVLSAASEKEKALLLTDATTSTAPPSLVSEPAASSSTTAVTRTAASNNNTLTGWHIHTRIAATFRDPATRWILQLVLITMLVAAAAHQVQQAIVYQGDVWLAKAAKSTFVGVSDALSWLDFPEEPAYAPAPVEEDDGAIVGGVKWQRAVDKLWGAPQEHQGRACKVVDQESGRCVEEGGAEAEDLWELGRSWRMAVS